LVVEVVEGSWAEILAGKGAAVVGMVCWDIAEGEVFQLCCSTLIARPGFVNASVKCFCSWSLLLNLAAYGVPVLEIWTNYTIDGVGDFLSAHDSKCCSMHYIFVS
jgi:hypothetical protein